MFSNSNQFRTCAVALTATVIVLAQGVATRSVKPAPRAKPSGKPFLAKFVDIAAEAGLRTPSIYGSDDRKDYILEVVGGGTAFLDYNGDGWLDILVLGGSRLDDPAPGTTNRLYRNEKNGKFTDVTQEAGLTKTGWASSVTVGDYDNDGWTDLFITYFGQNVLYRNRGDGAFEDVTKAAALTVEGTPWHSGATWIDYNADGFLDLFVATYLDFDVKKVPKTGADPSCNWKGIPVNCGPRGLHASGHKLYRNLGNGKFEDVSGASGIAAVRGSYAMTAVAGDYDNDGKQDIYVACDSTRSYLFRNNGDGTFSEEGLERGAALSEDGQEQAGMGVATGDYDLDGDIDIYKTHFADDTDVLYQNDGAGNFEDVTIAAGLAVETRYIRWGAGMADLDHDGLPDLFAVSGSVYPEIEARLPAYAYKGPRLVFRNLGKGRFEELIEEAGPGIVAAHSSRGAAFGDFDNDGDVDIVVMNLGEPPSLLRNDLPAKSGNWLQIELRGARSNRSAIGARVTVQYPAGRQAQEVTAQSSFYSCNSQRLHFGLGDAADVEVTVRWPSGQTETRAVKVNQILKWVEAS